MNKHLIKLCGHWDYDMKGDMMECIEIDMDNGMTLIESLEMLINEFFPIWIEENEDKEIYINYQARFKEVLEEIKDTEEE